MDVNATLVDKRVLVFFNTALTKEDLKKNAVIDFPDASPAFTGAIPGLYIFDDFVTEEEGATLVKDFDDTGKW